MDATSGIRALSIRLEDINDIKEEPVSPGNPNHTFEFPEWDSS